MDSPQRLIGPQNDGARRTGADLRPTLAIRSGEVHLWCVFLREASDESLLAEYRALLDARERDEERSFYFAHDRRRYVMSRALVRTVLSRYASVRAEKLIFAPNCNGRPGISHPNAAIRVLTFSVAHTNGLVALAVARDRALGVDIESLCMHEAATELSDLFFAADEVAAMQALRPDLQQRRFFECWTLKDAYIKARGGGFSIPMDKFSFQFRDEKQLTMSIHPDLNDSPKRWRMWQFCLGGNYVVAVCAGRESLESPQLTVREVVPLRSERDLDTLELRVLE